MPIVKIQIIKLTKINKWSDLSGSLKNTGAPADIIKFTTKTSPHLKKQQLQSFRTSLNAIKLKSCTLCVAFR